MDVPARSAGAMIWPSSICATSGTVSFSWRNTINDRSCKQGYVHDSIGVGAPAHDGALVHHPQVKWMLTHTHADVSVYNSPQWSGDYARRASHASEQTYPVAHPIKSWRP
eukprot:6225900-Amphidinium_carterae.2